MKDQDDTDEAIRASLGLLFSVMEGCNGGRAGTRCLFCWDAGAKKDKQRAPKPAGFHSTLDEFIDFVPKLLGTPNALIQGYEADDLVATAVFESAADRIYVVSGDKDLQQLHGGPVTYYSLNTKGPLSNHTILSKWSVKHPSQMAIALAILGDKVDAIDGLKGWGAKKVAQLFKHVRPDMNFEEALTTISDQVPEHMQDKFWDSFSLTLLNSGIADVPSPGVIRWADGGLLDDMGFDSLSEWYHRLSGVRGSGRSQQRRVDEALAMV